MLKHGYVNKIAEKASKEKSEQEAANALSVVLLEPLSFNRAATASGVLFGSVSVSDVTNYVRKQLKNSDTLNVEIPQAIKSVGKHSITINNQAAVVLVSAL